MDVRFPDLSRRSLGIGLDLHWGGRVGLQARDDDADALSPALAGFVERYRDTLGHSFFSWQPRSRGRLSAGADLDAYQQLVAAMGPSATVGLHHTALNLAHSDRYPRAELLEHTNRLLRATGMRWVNEDLGLWSVAGKPLPYPLPPFLTDDGLAVCVDAVRQVNTALLAPLLVEFPGFSSDWSLVVGPWDAYDFFREVVHRSEAACTLDTGHLLSWRWLQGHRGDALLHDLDRLPLDHCFEVHLSGAEVRDGVFFDAHHGVLLDAQLDLLDALVERCPNLRAVTFEDPRLCDDGRLEPASQQAWDRLQQRLAGWLA